MTITCTIEGCERPVRVISRGLCSSHYSRWQRETGAPCKIDGCTKPIQGRGWCGMHYARWQRGNDPTIDPPARSDLCSIDGCEGPNTKRGYGGLCRKHTARAERGKDPAVEPQKTPQIEHPGYRGMHARIVRMQGPASERLCADCGGQAAEWSYDHTDPNELTELIFALGLFMPYSTDQTHYQPLCKRCHVRRDAGPREQTTTERTAS